MLAMYIYTSLLVHKKEISNMVAFLDTYIKSGEESKICDFYYINDNISKIYSYVSTDRNIVISGGFPFRATFKKCIELGPKNDINCFIINTDGTQHQSLIKLLHIIKEITGSIEIELDGSIVDIWIDTLGIRLQKT